MSIIAGEETRPEAAKAFVKFGNWLMHERKSAKGRTVADFAKWFRQYLHAHPELAGKEQGTFGALATIYWGMAQRIEAGRDPIEYLLELIDTRELDDEKDFDRPLQLPPDLELALTEQLRKRKSNWPVSNGVPTIPPADREPLRIELVPANTPGFRGGVTLYATPTLNAGWLEYTPNDPDRANQQSLLTRADIDALPLRDNTDLPYHSRNQDVKDGENVQVSHSCAHDDHATKQLMSDIILLQAGMVEPVSDQDRNGLSAAENELLEDWLWQGPCRSLYEPAEENAVVMASGLDGGFIAEPEELNGSMYTARLGALTDVGAVVGFHNQLAEKPEQAGAWGSKSGHFNTGAVFQRTKIVASTRDGAKRAISRATFAAAQFINEAWDQTTGQVLVAEWAAKLTGNPKAQAGIEKVLQPIARWLRPLQRKIFQNPPTDSRLVAAQTRVITQWAAHGPIISMVASPRTYSESTQLRTTTIAHEAATTTVRRAERRDHRQDRRWGRRKGPLKLPAGEYKNSALEVEVRGDQVHGARPYEGVYTTGMLGHVASAFPNEVGARVAAARLAQRFGLRPNSTSFDWWHQRLVGPMRVARAIRRGVGLGNVRYAQLDGMHTAPPGYDPVSEKALDPPNAVPETGRFFCHAVIPEGLSWNAAGLPEQAAAYLEDTWSKRLPKNAAKNFLAAEEEGAVQGQHIRRVRVSRGTSSAGVSDVLLDSSRVPPPVDEFTLKKKWQRCEVRSRNTFIAPIINNDQVLNDHVMRCAQEVGIPVTEVESPGMASDPHGYNNADDGTPAAEPIPLIYFFIYRSQGGKIHSAGCDGVADNPVGDAIALTWSRISSHQNPALGLNQPRGIRHQRRPFDDSFVDGRTVEFGAFGPQGRLSMPGPDMPDPKPPIRWRFPRRPS